MRKTVFTNNALRSFQLSNAHSTGVIFMVKKHVQLEENLDSCHAQHLDDATNRKHNCAGAFSQSTRKRSQAHDPDTHSTTYTDTNTQERVSA